MYFDWSFVRWFSMKYSLISNEQIWSYHLPRNSMDYFSKTNSLHWSYSLFDDDKFLLSVVIFFHQKFLLIFFFRFLLEGKQTNKHRWFEVLVYLLIEIFIISIKDWPLRNIIGEDSTRRLFNECFTILEQDHSWRLKEQNYINKEFTRQGLL